MKLGHHSPTSLFHALLLGTPDGAWTSLLFWIVRLLTFSLLLRTYLIPWFLAVVSRHVRIRSVSLRSIRGLYIRTGSRTLRVDRVSYTWVNGGFNVRLYGLNIEFGKTEAKGMVTPLRGHNRTLTLADFAPSPMAYRLRQLIWNCYSSLEPYFRPLIRTCVVACLRLLIRWLPFIVSGLTFELHSTSFTFSEMPGTRFVAEKTTLHANLSFTQLEQVTGIVDVDKMPRSLKSRRLIGMVAWRRRLTESFQRSLDRAWGKAQGTAEITFRLYNVTGSTRPPALAKSEKPVEILKLPGVIDFEASMGFNPREGTTDTHSLGTTLNIGDCFIKLDALNSLLASLREIQFQQPRFTPTIEIHKPILTSSDYVLTSPSENIMLNPSDTEQLFSPVSSVMPPHGQFPPYSATLSSDVDTTKSPTSPASPFLEALSASIRPRRRFLRQPCSRLRDSKSTSLLSVLRLAKISISTVTLSVQPRWAEGPYETTIHNLSLSSNLCDAESDNHLHEQWLGRCRKLDNYDPDSYIFKLSVQKVAVERRTRLDSLQLLTVGTVELQALATQWPAPWLVPSPFLCGDPNAPLLAIHMKVEGVEVTERVECLRQLVAEIEPSVEHRPSRSTSMGTHRKAPRVIFELECGTIRGRIICGDPRASKPVALELRTNGLIISAKSNFGRDASPAQPTSAHSASIPLRMNYSLFVVLEPTLVRVRSKPATGARGFTTLRTSDTDFLDDPPVISIESIELLGEGHAIASLVHDGDSIASVLPSSSVFELQTSTDTICVELWHPNVIATIHQLFSIVPASGREVVQSSPPKPLLDKFPGGAAATLAVARFVVIVTAPDVNPLDVMDLSRGFAFRTTFAAHYSSMHADHAHRFHNLTQRTETRLKLSLPQEKIVDAVAAARVSTITHDVSAYIKICLANVAFRSAVATQYDADDPLIAEKDDPSLNHEEFLRIANVNINMCFLGKRGSDPPRDGDTCDVIGEVPHIRIDFQLAHVYNVLLALQTLHSLRPVKTPRLTAPIPPTSVLYHFNISITTIQMIMALPKQRLVTRIDGIVAGQSSLRWNRAAVYVRMPSQLNKWDEDVGEKWEELIVLHLWDISILPTTGTTSILVEADSARVRIPFGFVLADLITEATVTLKAVRHLSRVAVTGHYSNMISPEPEGPKAMPNLSLRLRCLCLEASDDPFESKLSTIWRCGEDAVAQRLAREDAFTAKVAAILDAEMDTPPGISDPEPNYQFGANHSVSIDEARRRLDEVHALDWTLRLQDHTEKRCRSEDVINERLRGTHAIKSKGIATFPDIIQVSPPGQIPPLFRATLNHLSLTAQSPSFPAERLPDFLHENGNGLPRETQFSLLIPMHLNFTLSSLHLTLRNYPLPLFSIPPHRDSSIAVLEFDTDLVIGEEMGTDLSVDWIDCPILEPHSGVHGSSPLSISVPKTIMPVKSYANPTIHVTTTSATIFSWGVSYTPAIQDLMRVIETLSSSPRDPSPVVGFWDKMRLVFHWSIVASFKGEVRFHVKGSRNPYQLLHNGAGFVLSFQGNTKLLVGRRNEDAELIQVVSDSMFIAIPNLEHVVAHNQRASYAHHIPEASKPYQKICAKLRSGVRFGIGFVLERSCGTECLRCSGTAFHRECRYFEFRPHYDVKLEKKLTIPLIKGPEDSYNAFRSDFIHLSLSLASSTRSSAPGTHHHHDPSSFHLTPKSFTHFWKWCSLFEGVLSLPIRQGSIYPPRPISPKLGRHIATLKYRVRIRRLFISHAYIDESRETWVDGVMPWIGVKGMIDEFQADLHQRDEESIAPGFLPETTKVLRRKPFYAAEVVLRGLDLRAMLSTFNEPLRQAVKMSAPSQRGNYGTHKDLPITEPSSVWSDADDFIETDWSPSEPADLHLLPVVSCPHFTYFKRNSVAPLNATKASKFGAEHSHTCLLGKEPSVPQVQISLALARIIELKKAMRHKRSTSDKTNDKDRSSVEKMVTLLEDYVALLRETDKSPDGNHSQTTQSYILPSYTVSPDEWAEFENVYQIHCPKVYMDSAIRDIMMQYYYCSRARRGIEYHMATRAVKFIRDQAEAALATKTENEDEDDPDKPRGTGTTAQMAASALRKILKTEQPKASVEVSTDPTSEPLEAPDPLSGWSDGVSLRKSHCCLLLKPQIILRGEGPKEVCIVAAVQAKLQSFAIMDNSNADDPISGKVMSRNYTSLSGLQTFSPVGYLSPGDGCVPFEVLIDLRCESNDFDRLVPQTDATFHYDKFNRLRLRNNVTSVVRANDEKATSSTDNHLQDQTDLIRVHIPRFTVSASDEHFQAISHIVTKLLLFSDAAHKIRLDKLDTLLFTYDFTDLGSAANVVAELQGRLNDVTDTTRAADTGLNPKLQSDEGKLELLKHKAHIYLMSEELGFLFDAIKLAQDRSDDRMDQKSALLLHASSSEISWRMLDDRRDLLSKLVVQDINYYWLNRQDSSTGNDLSLGNLQAFDGSRHALWPEILSKHDEPANHFLSKRGLFLLANWTILAPVGGITIYESFELSLHPMRLQIDARVGRRIMEYLWPARRHRQSAIDDSTNETLELQVPKALIGGRTSLDSPRTLHGSRADSNKGDLAPPPLRKLGTSRSFTDLRGMKDTLQLPTLQKMHSTETLRHNSSSDVRDGQSKHKRDLDKKAGDAAEMKTRASQKSFVLVRIASLDLLLSIAKEGSFECREARIRTRDLEYRNQTWSFEELVNQFIPSDMSWRGWVKMAFHQPLLPVLPVARELISKTKWTSSAKAAPQIDVKGPPPKLPRAKVLSIDDDSKLASIHSKYTRAKSGSPSRGWRKGTRKKSDDAHSTTAFTTLPLTAEPESLDVEDERPSRSNSRKRMMSIFTRSKSNHMSSSSTLRNSVDETLR